MSARDRFKAANNFVTLGSEANKETIVDDIIKGIDSAAEANSTVKDVVSVEEKSTTSKPTVEEFDFNKASKNPYIDKLPKEAPQERKFGGRPRKFKEGAETKTIGVKLFLDEAQFLEEYGGKYGGKTGYVTHLIHQEMERLGIKVKNR